MKQSYQRPQIEVEEMQTMSLICASTRVVTNVMDGNNSDTGIGYGGGGNGPARARQNNVWDEWDE